MTSFTEEKVREMHASWVAFQQLVVKYFRHRYEIDLDWGHRYHLEPDIQHISIEKDKVRVQCSDKYDDDDLWVYNFPFGHLWVAPEEWTNIIQAEVADSKRTRENIRKLEAEQARLQRAEHERKVRERLAEELAKGKK